VAARNTGMLTNLLAEQEAQDTSRQLPGAKLYLPVEGQDP
jgi:hypothetical protein